MNSISKMLTVVLVCTMMFITGCSQNASNERLISQAVEQCDGDTVISNQKFLNVVEYENVDCYRKSGELVSFSFKGGMAYIDNDADNALAECAIKNANLVKDDDGTFRCAPKTPKTKIPFS